MTSLPPRCSLRSGPSSGRKNLAWGGSRAPPTMPSSRQACSFENRWRCASRDDRRAEPRGRRGDGFVVAFQAFHGLQRGDKIARVAAASVLAGSGAPRTMHDGGDNPAAAGAGVMGEGTISPSHICSWGRPPRSVAIVKTMRRRTTTKTFVFNLVGDFFCAQVPHALFLLACTLRAKVIQPSRLNDDIYHF